MKSTYLNYMTFHLYNLRRAFFANKEYLAECRNHHVPVQCDKCLKIVNIIAKLEQDVEVVKGIIRVLNKMESGE